MLPLQPKDAVQQFVGMAGFSVYGLVGDNEWFSMTFEFFWDSAYPVTQLRIVLRFSDVSTIFD